MGKKVFRNQGTITVEVHTQLRNALSNIENRKVIIKIPFDSGNYNNKRDERNGWKSITYFICVLEDHFI